MDLPAATSAAIAVLVSTASRMQSQLLTNALRRRSEFHLTTCSTDLPSLLKAVSSSVPRVVLWSPNGSLSLAENMSTMRQFHFVHPGLLKVLLIDACDRNVVVAAFRSGVRGIFCLPDANIPLLRRCIEQVASGQIWANTEQLEYLLELVSEVPSMRIFNTGGDPLLTPREEQVVALVSEGLSNRDIARELRLSEHTIKKYLFRIFEKLGISSRVELVLYAVNHGDPRQGEWLNGLSQTPQTKLNLKAGGAPHA